MKSKLNCIFLLGFFLGLVLVGCNKQEAVGRVENVSKLQTKAKHDIQYFVNQNDFNIYSENHATQKLALLTFDDAPRRTDVDEKILNTLDKYHAKAIWFVNGYFFADEKGNLKPRANMIREIKRRGHFVGNHTFSHKDLLDLEKKSMRNVEDEIRRNSEDINRILGEKPIFFRPPYGSYDEAIQQFVQKQGMQLMNWSVMAKDWKLKDPQKIKEQISRTMHPGGNILMHDYPWTADALDGILKGLKDEGYTFVTPTD